MTTPEFTPLPTAPSPQLQPVMENALLSTQDTQLSETLNDAAGSEAIMDDPDSTNHERDSLDILAEILPDTTDVAGSADINHFNDQPTTCKFLLFTKIPSSEYIWSETMGETMNGADFNQAITSDYAEVAHWRHNLFLTY